MARPKTPAKVLELRGAFKRHPERRRQDAEGAGVFEIEPPSHLPQDAVPAWRWIVARLPKVVLTSSDEVAVEAACYCLAGMWQIGPMAAMHPSFGKLSAELRQWLGKLGMTPQDRTKIPPADEKPGSGNPFADA